MDGIVERLGLEGLVQVVNELVRAFRRDFLVVVAAEEGTTVDGVELLEDLVDANEFVG